MKVLILLLFFTASGSLAWGQICNLSYTYDNVGNRVKRQYLLCFGGGNDDMAALRSIVKDNKPLQNLQLSKVELKAFPNPNNGVFEVVIEKTQENTSLDIYDFSGRKVSTQAVLTNTTLMSVNNLAAGSYMIIYRDTEKVLGQLKVIIE
ncbi:MAG: T9SS type A sorting domain-containing protein [Saprospiraceae bacterium]|nr:T9SS type A sorting domain-containing protein [Saprospiraceae bacterium]